VTRMRARWMVPMAAASVALAVSAGAGLAGPAGAAGKSTAKTDKTSATSMIQNPGTTSLTETGSTLLYPLFNIWVPAYTQKFPDVSITTAGTGSGTGITDATNATVDIGASDAYLSPQESSASPDLRNIPLAISAQMIVYNIPGVTAHVKLSGKVISAIYQGTIKTWNDPAITALNPGVTLPSTPIVALHRSDGSGDTFIFSQYLSKSDPTGWGTKISYGTTVSWPNIPNALAENGNGGMVAGCSATPGCIAYVGISYRSEVLQDTLGQAQIQNQKGNFLLPTNTTIEAEAAGFVQKTPPNGTISLVYGPAAQGYPIINYEYAIVSTHQSNATTATAIKSLLAWAINPSDGNSSTYLSQVTFEPLPARVMNQSLKQIASIG